MTEGECRVDFLKTGEIIRVFTIFICICKIQRMNHQREGESEKKHHSLAQVPMRVKMMLDVSKRVKRILPILTRFYPHSNNCSCL